MGVVRPGHFLCGCNPKAKRGYSGDTMPSLVPGQLPVYTDKRYDEQGFEVCPEHGERMYGFASVPTSDEAGYRPDFSVKSSGRISTVNFDHEDRRDNRDPVDVYNERQREKAQAANGHAG